MDGTLADALDVAFVRRAGNGADHLFEGGDIGILSWDDPVQGAQQTWCQTSFGQIVDNFVKRSSHGELLRMKKRNDL